jgi:hypothetical protein
MAANPKKKPLEQVVKEKFPQYSYLLESPEIFGEDMIAVFRKGLKYKWTADRLAGAISNTNYWKTTVGAAKRFDAATPADQETLMENTRTELQSVSDFSGLSDSDVGTFVRDMARRGITGENLKKMAYSLVFQKGVESEAAQEALFSENASNIKKVAKAYGASLDDATVASYLQEGRQPGDIQRMYKEKLKGLYPHLSSQLDADLTFDDITNDYKYLASRVLERPGTEIDFSKPEFLESIATRDEKGNYRQLSLGEWQVKLKTDDKYGYSKTKTAVQDARKLAASISRSFGKVM